MIPTYFITYVVNERERVYCAFSGVARALRCNNCVVVGAFGCAEIVVLIAIKSATSHHWSGEATATATAIACDYKCTAYIRNTDKHWSKTAITIRHRLDVHYALAVDSVWLHFGSQAVTATSKNWQCATAHPLCTNIIFNLLNRFSVALKWPSITIYAIAFGAFIDCINTTSHNNYFSSHDEWIGSTFNLLLLNMQIQSNVKCWWGRSIIAIANISAVHWTFQMFNNWYIIYWYQLII